jgi:hypothetical protein
MNDQIGITHGPLDCAKSRFCKWQHMLAHADYHPRPTQTGAVGECLRKVVRAAFDRLELQSMRFGKWRERRGAGNTDAMPYLPQAST